MEQKHYGFLPGCSLSSYQPEYVGKITAYLNERLPDFSAILKCCGKPTKDIGEYEHFKERFGGLVADAEELGIEKMILACPNCKATFDSESEIPTVSLWEVLAELGLPDELKKKAADSDMIFTIHDSCSARYDKGAQDGVRRILSELGYQVVESEESREHTRCCGFGGMVASANPGIARKVAERRVRSLHGYPTVVYCSSCRSMMLQAGVKAWHILDLIYGPVVYRNDLPTENIIEDPGNVWRNRVTAKECMKKAMSQAAE
ncbi:MAG: (Fe-S)-binding protein [Clostridiales bacterium]|nr:(Fe-S)-binding protein [Clostridiales bacterium]